MPSGTTIATQGGLSIWLNVCFFPSLSRNINLSLFARQHNFSALAGTDRDSRGRYLRSNGCPNLLPEPSFPLPRPCSKHSMIVPTFGVLFQLYSCSYSLQLPLSTCLSCALPILLPLLVSVPVTQSLLCVRFSNFSAATVPCSYHWYSVLVLLVVHATYSEYY